MNIHFTIRYRTYYGQELFVEAVGAANNSGEMPERFSLEFLDGEHWHGVVDLPHDTTYFRYKYVVRQNDGHFIEEADTGRSVSPRGKEMHVFDQWVDAGDTRNFYYSNIFQQVLLRPPNQPKTLPQQFTHEFKVRAPLLKKHEVLCMIGSTQTFGHWQTGHPLLMQREQDYFIARISLKSSDWPLAYKYGVYNLLNKKFQYFEQGANRHFFHIEENRQYVIHDGYARFQHVWKGAGIAVPVFSLRSKNGFGTGEFTDIPLLIDWAKKTGIQLIQLLPVNDTITNNTWADSYPYAAISAIALHPLYINLKQVAGREHAPVLRKLSAHKRKLNALGEVNYPKVIQLKLAALRELFELQQGKLKADGDFKQFVTQNDDWLRPYAIFSTLRDQFNTPDYSKWPGHTVYTQKLADRMLKDEHTRTKIYFYYYIQYHLHRQLREATNYARQNGVAVKGDLPIGLYRFSCDVWLNPHMVHLDRQAGAPPDDFAVTGQNWGFPTYNWDHMARDGYAWWKRRLSHMNHYFDAFRIDHILGFFRIWSIPRDQTEGIMGRFDPAIPVSRQEFASRNIHFDRDRYCKPYITPQTLQEIFGSDIRRIMKTYLTLWNNRYKLKEKYNTQRKIDEIDEPENVKHGLKALCANVILFEDKHKGERQFHFRFDIANTNSIRDLDYDTKQSLYRLYDDYYYQRQDSFWKENGKKKLEPLKEYTNMLIFGEDLGLVPPVVPQVMRELRILSLEVERMPKSSDREFFHPADAPYFCVVTPSTHDMSTLREWWHEDVQKTQRFYNFMLGNYGKAPRECTPDLALQIVNQHVHSPAMWSIFQLQDLFALQEDLRVSDYRSERINDPANPNNRWQYRMPITLEKLLEYETFNQQIGSLLTKSERGPI